MRIAVIGLGKAGLPLAAVIADAGIPVLGLDKSEKRAEEINQGTNPIPEEPELGELIKKHHGKNLKATTSYADIKNCDAFIVIVPLFIDEKTKKPDFSLIENVMNELSKIIKDRDLVVLETTVPPGTTNTLVKPILDKSGKKYLLAYSPERIMTGYSVSRYRDFPKVVGGINPESTDAAFRVYSRFCKKVGKASNALTAEMVKVAEGIYRDVNIALGNELLKVCDTLGIDYFEVIKNANHEFCQLHEPGNVGGHCIPVYPWFLINNYPVPLIREARLLNDDMIEYYATKVKKMTKGKKGKVLFIGITFREGVKELAYTRSLPFIRLLRKKGFDVYVYDPMYTEQEIKELGLRPDYSADYKNFDAIILFNKYVDMKQTLMKFKDKIVDIRNVLGKN